MSTASAALRRFVFTDPNRRQACCGIRIFPLPDGRTFVIATELADNPGMSITNAAEAAATAVCRRSCIDPHRLIWIEHYSSDSYADAERAETFDRVEFHCIIPTAPLIFTGPWWRRMSVSDLLALGIEFLYSQTRSLEERKVSDGRDAL